MISDEPPPVEVGGHQLNMTEAVIHSTEPVAHHALLAVVSITIIVVIAALIGFFRRGRSHVTALALTRMLSPLAPLIGLFGTAMQIASCALLVADRNIANPAVWAPSILVAAWIIAISAVCGGIGVALTAGLRLGGPDPKVNRGG